MKKRALILSIVVSVLLMVPAHAVSARTIRAAPSLKFNNTKATCSVEITVDWVTDKIAADMELWQGNTLIDNWSGNGIGVLELKGTATVEKNKTYTLVVYYSVNGEDPAKVSVSRTNE